MMAEGDSAAGSFDSCVSSCRSTLANEGINPDSCCDSDMQAGQVCVIECEGEGSGCMSDCEDSLMLYTGLGPDDCVVPY